MIVSASKYLTATVAVAVAVAVVAAVVAAVAAAVAAVADVDVVAATEAAVVATIRTKRQSLIIRTKESISQKVLWIMSQRQNKRPTFLKAVRPFAISYPRLLKVMTPCI